MDIANVAPALAPRATVDNEGVVGGGEEIEDSRLNGGRAGCGEEGDGAGGLEDGLEAGEDLVGERGELWGAVVGWLGSADGKDVRLDGDGAGGEEPEGFHQQRGGRSVVGRSQCLEV